MQGAGLEAEPPALAGRPKSRKREMARMPLTAAPKPPWAEAWQMLERLNTKILTNSPTRDVGCLAKSNVRGRLTGSFTSGGGL